MPMEKTTALAVVFILNRLNRTLFKIVLEGTYILYKFFA